MIDLLWSKFNKSGLNDIEIYFVLDYHTYVNVTFYFTQEKYILHMHACLYQCMNNNYMTQTGLHGNLWLPFSPKQIIEVLHFHYVLTLNFGNKTYDQGKLMLKKWPKRHLVIRKLVNNKI